MKRIALVILVSAVFLLLPGCGAGALKDLNVISVAELDGMVFPADSNGVKLGGVSLLSQQIKDIKQGGADKNSTIIVGNGNFLYGTPEAFFTEGKAVIDSMNMLGFNLLVIGHREFYFGKDVLSSLSKVANFPFVCANVVNDDGTVPDYIKPYVIFDKVKTAVIGVISYQFSATNIPENIKGLKYLDPAEMVNKYVKEIRAKGITRILVAGEMNYVKNPDPKSNDADFLNKVTDVNGVDLYLAITTDKIQLPVDMVVQKREKKQVKICYTGILGQSVGLYTCKGGKESWKLFPVDSDNVKPDPALVDFIGILNSNFAAISGQIVGTALNDIPHDFKKESPLGNLITDIMREFCGTDVFLRNSGSIRAGFKKGPITKMDLYRVQPWEGNIATADVTGEQLLKILESSVSFKLDKSFLQVSGVKFKYDPKKEPGHRIVEGSVFVNGKPLDPKKTYTMGTTEYVFGGGDGYTEIKDMGIVLKKLITKPMRSIVEEYILRVHDISGSIQGRIVAVQ